MYKKKILIVDDDLVVLKFLRANLQEEGYETLGALNGVEALHIVEKELPDLIILDIVMPTMDGFEVCRCIREWSQIPIIILSAIENEQEKAKCLDLGADDYLTKPFGVLELNARVRTVFRHTRATSTKTEKAIFSIQELKVDFNERRVTVDGHEVKLTPTEYRFLKELALNAGKVLTHAHLLRKIWGPEYLRETEYLHVYIKRLRAKLDSGKADSKYIVTVPGIGYRLKSE
jgi:two-component system KDP operon response regulator KdpE